MGLFDVNGMKQLCYDGIQLFPESPWFPLFLSIALQVQCQSLDIAMLYLKKAKKMLMLGGLAKEREMIKKVE